MATFAVCGAIFHLAMGFLALTYEQNPCQNRHFSALAFIVTLLAVLKSFNMGLVLGRNSIF